jgi:hypothetical protein
VCSNPTLGCAFFVRVRDVERRVRDVTVAGQPLNLGGVVLGERTKFESCGGQYRW